MSEEQKRELGKALQKALAKQFSRYNLMGKTWAQLTLSGPKSGEPSEIARAGGSGLL
jgi:hypothetical protein